MKIIEDKIVSLRELGLQPKDIKYLDYLKWAEKLNLEDGFIYLQNFCGYLTEDILVIPSKLRSFIFSEEETCKGEINPPLEDKCREIFNEIFNKFLEYIIKELSKEDIIYSLNLTSFSVNETKTADSKIFKLLLLLSKKEELINSIHFILSNPHKDLIEYEEYKRFDEVSLLDEHILVDIITNPHFLHKDEKGAIENKYTPSKVLQYEVEESFDTLENRFIKYFLKELDFILSTELKEFLPLNELKEIKEGVEYALQSDVFSEIRDLSYFPSNSQVLMKRAGYRELFQIYRLFHVAFVPQIFKSLDIAFSLKDMATLWEYYVLIELLKELKKIYGDYVVKANFEPKSKFNTIYDYAEFEFNDGIKLFFQKTLKSYSRLEYRPDFLIEKDRKRFIFDAKFRIFEENRKDILQNMHYYRDGLNAEFSIAVCFGKDLGKDKKNKEIFFYSQEKNEKEELNLKGIGYLILYFGELQKWKNKENP